MSANVSPTLIVGAGPTGLSLAIALRQRGARVIVIDRQTQGANTSRAAVIHARTLQVLEQLGVTTNLLEEGIIVPKFCVRDRDRLLLDVDFGELPGRYPFTLMLPQDQTEAILRSRLQDLGVEVQWATELDTVVQQGDQLVAHLKSPDGNIDMHASWVVGCDGLHSKVREEAEIPFVGGTYRQEFVLADVIVCSDGGKESSTTRLRNTILVLAKPKIRKGFKDVGITRIFTALPRVELRIVDSGDR